MTTATSTVLATSTLVSTTTKVVTSTEIKPYSPTGTYVSPVGASFNDYNGIDFQRGDLDGGVFCSCKITFLTILVARTNILSQVPLTNPAQTALFEVITTASALASTLARISVLASTRTLPLSSAQVSHIMVLKSVVPATSRQLLKVVDT